MKKNIIYMLLFIFVFLFTSCGKSMNNWPVINLNLEIENYHEISIQYNTLPYKNSLEETHLFASSNNQDIIFDLYNLINELHYQKKAINKLDTRHYWENIIIEFQSDKEQYYFKFYSYGVKNGFFIFDNGEIHKYYGDLVNLIFSRYQNTLNWEVV
jgi:hypothetical protein